MSRMLSEGAARPNADERRELGDFTATRRLLILSAIAICLGAIGAVLALVLLRLIAFFTNIFFYGRISFQAASPADSNLGVAIIIIPVIGALIISVLNNGLRIMSIPQEWQNVILGLVILAAVYADMARKKSG